MNAQAQAQEATSSPIGENHSSRLEPMLIRLPPILAEQLRRLARETRIRQSDYLREAVVDLLAKYGNVIEKERS